MQSKRGDLEKAFKKFRINRKNYICAKKGDFSLLRNADLIISIGWQSLALKAASAYKKPLIFYSQYKYPYDDFIFSMNQINNTKINKYCKNLWLSEKDLNLLFSKIILEKKVSKFVKDNSYKLLEGLFFY